MSTDIVSDFCTFWLYTENVAVAVEGLTTATIAILATLRLRFAKAITLGTAIGEVLSKILGPFVAQALELTIPADYEKWIPVSRHIQILQVSCCFACVRSHISNLCNVDCVG